MDSNRHNARRPAATAEQITARGGFRKITTEPAPAQVDCRPEFCRGNDLRHLFGLSRSTGYGLLKAGEIRGITLRKPGQKFATRLFDCQSVRDFIARCAGNAEQ